MKPINTKKKSLRTTLLAIIGMVLLALGLWIYPTERVYAEEEPPEKVLNAEEAEFGILRQKAMTEDLTPEEEKRKEWLSGQIMKRILEARLGRYLLESVVLDEEGKPLDKISLRISKENLIGFDKWKTDREERVINGTFSASARGYFGIRLTFNKEGYFEESVYFSTPDPDDYRNPEEPMVDQRNIRIVMEKKGDISVKK